VVLYFCLKGIRYSLGGPVVPFNYMMHKVLEIRVTDASNVTHTTMDYNHTTNNQLLFHPCVMSQDGAALSSFLDRKGCQSVKTKLFFRCGPCFEQHGPQGDRPDFYTDEGQVVHALVEEMGSVHLICRGICLSVSKSP
jgi:hypothetical protein